MKDLSFVRPGGPGSSHGAGRSIFLLRFLCDFVCQALRLDSPFNPELTAGLQKAAALGGSGTAHDGEAAAASPKTAGIQRCRPKAAPIVNCFCSIVPVSHVSGLF
jgi:hypothetical protein